MKRRFVEYGSRRVPLCVEILEEIDERGRLAMANDAG
jgi:hypothetical protein